MSRLRRSPDPVLFRLIEDGYDLDIVAGHLVVRGVPYVRPSGDVARGDLVMVLDMAGELTRRPSTHVAMFTGEPPCDEQGRPLARIINSVQARQLAPSLDVTVTFSSKPAGGYGDFYEKVTTYVALLSAPAQALDPDATAQSRMSPAAAEAGDARTSPFQYVDTASARAGIANIASRLVGHQVAIVGLGGTGSYVLDLVAKTPVDEIHLYDGDVFAQHNAFRAPGAADVDTIERCATKVAHFGAVYSRLHRGIVEHAAPVSSDNVDDLRQMDFVFVCVDDGQARRLIVETLVAAGVPFVDVGIGLYDVDDSIAGTVRTTIHLSDAPVPKGIPFDDGPNEYDQNIQVADLNALNAALAVVRWKRAIGFYNDLEQETESLFDVDGNALTNRCEP